MKMLTWFIMLSITIAVCYADCPRADLTGDCYVDLEDFAVFASQWLTGDEIPDVQTSMIWVYVDDPGIGGVEGFTGYMSKYETTNAQYCQYLNSALADGLITVYNNTVYAVTDTSHREPYFRTFANNAYSQIWFSNNIFKIRIRDGYDMGDHPVVMVSWYGANAFCDYYGWRLPSRWEWQAVADYDGSYIYGCGQTIDYSKANYADYNLGPANPLNLSSIPFTNPVDYYSSYGYGINDMAGNVKELTSSLVTKGGYWGSQSNGDCRVSGYDQISENYTDRSTGFRVCR